MSIVQEYIKIRGAKEHNLKNIDIDIPRGKLVLVTGLSGSGKSSLVFDIIYNEGQRKYVESLSSYIRQFLEMQSKPNVDSISGLSPAIAIDQKAAPRNPRSTVGTMTEIYDYLRLLFARVGIPYSPATGLPIKSQTIAEMISVIESLQMGTKALLLAPIAYGAKGEFRKEFLNLRKAGFDKVIIDAVNYDINDIPVLDKNKKHNIEVVVDRVVIGEAGRNRIASSLEAALKLSNGIVYLQFVELPESSNHEHDNDRIIFSEKYSCPVSGFQLQELEPRIFSFNTPFGACDKCHGIGHELFFDPSLIVPDVLLSINQGAIVPWVNGSKFAMQTLESISAHYNFSLDKPFNTLSDEVCNILFYGSGNQKIKFRYYSDSHNDIVNTPFGGIIPSLEEKNKKADTQALKEEVGKYLATRHCSQCNGYRLKQESLCVKIADKNIGDVSSMSVAEMQDWTKHCFIKMSKMEQQIAARIMKEIEERLSFLINVGLGYLTMSREANTLSGGESQRIRLASQIGSGLTGILYVLDEPSIGLHERDNVRLINTMKRLRDLGNTVIVVEHDKETMINAEYIIDIGPGAGIHGGEVVAQGSIEDIKNAIGSITGQYLRGEKFIAIPKVFRKGHEGKKIELIGASSNNLQKVDISIKLGTLTVITGVSGSGKSTLIIDTLCKALIKILEPTSKVKPNKFDKLSGAEYIDKIIEIDQSPIGRTPRSNPATYTGVFSNIRDWFVEIPDAKARGYSIGRFSFNVKGGRCESCQGDGLVKIEMHFLPDIYVKCEVCDGKRYNRETLEIKYNEKSISDVLDMTVDDALIFFEKVPTVRDKIQTLQEVGLGYIKLGQSATTLSGGEAQRIKLAKELTRKSTGKTLYILDEPTTGLHMDDINKLLKILHKLVDLGNTMIIIEHNMDVIKTADHIIDVGPEGGDKGGKIVVEGNPYDIAACSASITGQFLAPYLKPM